MEREPGKVLCIIFKFLGDVVVALPAVHALKRHLPATEIHVLVAEEAAPLVRTLPWIDRVWPLPRTRGKARLLDSWPVIRELREQNFDLSLDFVGNDRGALLSLAAGATLRLGLDAPRGFSGRRLCYHTLMPEAPFDWHETRRHLHFLRGFGVKADAPAPLELRADPALQAEAARLVAPGSIIGHITTSKALKEWPLPLWVELGRRARAAGWPFVFAAGPGAREQALLDRLRELAPEIPHLPPFPGLDLYLAVLAQARLLVSGDTGPMHFAAGLGVPTLSLFGPSRADLWAPVAPRSVCLSTPGCTCNPEWARCARDVSCFAGLSSAAVWDAARKLLADDERSRAANDLCATHACSGF